MRNDEQRLCEVILRIYERRSDEIRISPAWLATQAMVEMDEDRQSPFLVYRAAHLHLRQIARSLCRRKFEEDGAEREQNDLFPVLQTRYPAAHAPGVEPEYVLLDHMSAADKSFNVIRLRREAESKLHHADALEAWWRDRRAAS